MTKIKVAFFWDTM